MRRLDEDTIDDLLAEGGIALVLFGHPMSRPTMAQAQDFADLWADEPDAAHFAHIDALVCERAARRFNIRALPTTLMFRDGVLTEALQGYHSRARLEAVLTESAPLSVAA